MPDKLRKFSHLIDEREEVYFLLLLVILTAAWLGMGKLNATEYLAGVGGLYGLLIAGSTGKAFAHKRSAGGEVDE